MIRLNQLLTQKSLCSRRQADVWIQNNWVFVDGVVCNTLGSKVDPHSQIRISPLAQQEKAQEKTILLYKPFDYVSGPTAENYPIVHSLITLENYFNLSDSKNKLIKPSSPPPSSQFLKMAQDPRQLSVAGRLDIDSSGLMVLTQNGVIARQLIDPIHPVDKEYVVKFRGQLSEKHMNEFRRGLMLDGIKLRPIEIRKTQAQEVLMVLREGKKRQIRRMFEHFDLEVSFLKRIRIGRIKLGPLPLGQWRFLSNHEKF